MHMDRSNTMKRLSQELGDIVGLAGVVEGVTTQHRVAWLGDLAGASTTRFTLFARSLFYRIAGSLCRHQ